MNQNEAPLTDDELGEKLGRLSLRILSLLEATDYSYLALPRLAQVGPLYPLIHSAIARRNTLGWRSLTAEKVRLVIWQRHRSCCQRSTLDNLLRLAGEAVEQQRAAALAPASPANDRLGAAEEQEERHS